jgi:uncharacterized membrane protein YeaQ/YmgE (transglycosylase-associated protein family)
MSLKAFHFVFIIAAILLAAGFAAWSFMNYAAPGGAVSDLVVGLVSAAIGLGLIGYEIYFLKKLKHVSYL